MANVGNNDENLSDIDKWVINIERRLEDVPQYMCNPGHPGRICRIPDNLREADVKAYEPYILSIGPYHYGKTGLHQMEKRKHLFLKCVLEAKPEITLKDYLTEINSIELEARSFYSNIDMDSEKFVRLLLLDSLFILLLFCGMPRSWEGINHKSEKTTATYDNMDNSEKANLTNEGMENWVDIANTQKWFWSLFAHDLLLLENQLPFFVLQKIHDLAYDCSKTQLLLSAKGALKNLLCCYTTLDVEMVIEQTDEIHHLLHLCHMFFRPTLQYETITSQTPENSGMFRLGSAVQLFEAGVNFVARSGSTRHNLLDITFDGSGKLVMPCLEVDDNTFSLLRNLTALEQMKYPSMGLDVTAYAVLLLHLLTVPEDVQLLRKERIIQHHLASDKEMVYLINRLSVGLSFDYLEDKYNLKLVFQELKRYSGRRVPRWRAWLKHRYFTNPWTIISLMAASVLLLLSGLQTFYSVYSYYHPYFHKNP